jgi:sulfur carrier protein
MDIHINQKPLSLPDGATVADALAAFGARPPFAVALNGDFVARTQHAARVKAHRLRLTKGPPAVEQMPPAAR